GAHLHETTGEVCVDVEERFAEERRARPGADVSQVGTERAAPALNRVTRGAAVRLIHPGAARDVARKRLAPDAAEAPNEGDDLPGLTRTHRVARHAGAGDAAVHDAEQGLVCRRVAQHRACEVRAPATVATGAMTIR